MDAPEEKRKDRRTSLILQVEYPDLEGYVDDFTENLGAGGAFVRTERPLAVGDRLPLIVSFPGLLDPVNLVGVVAWVRPRQGDEPVGVGIRIPDDRPEDKQRLRELFARMESTPSEQAGQTAAPRPPFRILVVEDNPHLADMYEYAINKMAHTDAGSASLEVAAVGDGHQAWQRLVAEPFDLVLTDMYMPVLDGFQLIEKMRADPRLSALPIVAISAGGEQAARQAAQAGATVCLRKPVRFVDIVETVRALLCLRAN